ncbi:MAG: isoprenyl transferase [Syntrophomonadaceae bacterium]|nr:isoprenyl transferase [Syntrophomonadaceae bacterium]
MRRGLSLSKKNIDYKNLINPQKLPKHIAIIMDGNGRWAEKKFMPRTMGHRAGMSSLKKVVTAASNLNIPILTVFAFSTENWKRPVEEVDYLMNLLVEYLRKELDELHENNIRINMLGNLKTLPEFCQREIVAAIEKTANNKGMLFNIALNYGARDEMLSGVKMLIEKVLSNELSAENITEEIFTSLLYTKNIPDPDLLIRTAGEKRISNFLLWQIAYTELWFTDVLWPDFTEKDLWQAIYEYQQRDRRFGGLSLK